MKDPIKVLFVEDDSQMSEVYLENFLAPEFEAITAENGKKALAVLQTSDFDVVVTDNSMPVMDGMTLLRKIRHEFSELKVIIVTGYGNWSDYVDAYNLGVCKFIDKPVKMAELKELIRSLT